MKKLLLFLVLIGTLPLSTMAQDDDLYFRPSKPTERQVIPQSDYKYLPGYASSSPRNVDEYNRRGRYWSHYQVLGTDSMGNDIVAMSKGYGIYPDSSYIDTTFVERYSGVEAQDNDYTYSRRMSRWDGFYAPWSYGYHWSYDPWPYYWYGDPWYPYYGYAGWYSPYYDPWYYRGYAWYGWYGYPYYYYGRGYYPGYWGRDYVYVPRRHSTWQGPLNRDGSSSYVVGGEPNGRITYRGVRNRSFGSRSNTPTSSFDTRRQNTFSSDGVGRPAMSRPSTTFSGGMPSGGGTFVGGQVGGGHFGGGGFNGRH